MIDVYEVQIRQNPDNGIVEHEGWRLRGELHRVGAPALIHRDPQTGVAFIEQWFQKNLPHRVDGPAVIYRDPETGSPTIEEFHLNGKRVQSLERPEASPDVEPSP